MKGTLHPSLRKTYIALAVAVVVMFVFAFALVPFYSVFCKVTGLNGKTANQVATDINGTIDNSRWVTVEFYATNNAELPWQFRPLAYKMKVHPGQMAKTAYYAFNQTDHNMTVQAIPSVSPGVAAKYLKKLECFCFTQQSMAAHTGRNMPLTFTLDPNLPKDITTVSLSYTLFDLTNTIKHKEASL